MWSLTRPLTEHTDATHVHTTIKGDTHMLTKSMCVSLGPIAAISNVCGVCGCQRCVCVCVRCVQCVPCAVCECVFPIRQQESSFVDDRSAEAVKNAAAICNAGPVVVVLSAQSFTALHLTAKWVQPLPSVHWNWTSRYCAA